MRFATVFGVRALQKTFGEIKAKCVLDNHEDWNPNTKGDRCMDEFNNQEGSRAAKLGELGSRSSSQICVDMLNNGDLQTVRNCPKLPDILR